MGSASVPLASPTLDFSFSGAHWVSGFSFTQKLRYIEVLASSGQSRLYHPLILVSLGDFSLAKEMLSEV